MVSEADAKLMRLNFFKTFQFPFSTFVARMGNNDHGPSPQPTP